MNVKEYLDCYKKYDSNLEKIQQYNAELVDRYPFLLPRNVWTDELDEDYDYTYTWLDQMPSGWRIAFGDQLLEDLLNELKSANYVDEYRIHEIKEKWGGLRWYDNGNTDRWHKEILPKYENLSKRTCIFCGNPAKYITRGWVAPICEDCTKLNTYYNGYIPIEECFSQEDE